MDKHRCNMIILGSVGIFLTIFMGVIGIDAFKNNWAKNPAPFVYFSIMGIIFVMSLSFTIYQCCRNNIDEETNIY